MIRCSGTGATVTHPKQPTEKVSPVSFDLRHCISAAAKAESFFVGQMQRLSIFLCGVTEKMGCRKISCWGQHLC